MPDEFPFDDLVPGADAGVRLYRRLEPVAYDDANQGYALLYLAAALMSPREILEVVRADEYHAIPWGRVLDPDACPSELLDWLAVFAGVTLPPSALTSSEKRYRILQAAGRYRGTPRAVIEELQLVLTGTKTVYLGYHTPDEWHYSVATVAAETPDADAVERAVLAQKPVGMLVDIFTTDEWSSFVLAPTLIGYRDGDGYAIGTPDYPTCQSVLDAFATCADLEANNPI